MSKFEDASLNSDDDSLFFSALLDIAIDIEDNFERCRMFNFISHELSAMKTIMFIFETYLIDVKQAICVFVTANISNGLYNKRAVLLLDRLDNKSKE